MVFQHSFAVSTAGRSTVYVTRDIQAAIAAAGIAVGLAHVFVHHTSASLMLCENADPAVRSDLERFMQRLVPDGDPQFEHTDEGPDDMPAHVRAVLTHNDLSLPVRDGRADLGTWQGVYLWEHRTQPHRRKITVSVIG